jgi:hypothetical protein
MPSASMILASEKIEKSKATRLIVSKALFVGLLIVAGLEVASFNRR